MISLNSYSISSQFKMFRIFVGSVLFSHKGILYLLITSGSVYFSVTFQKIAIQLSPKTPLSFPTFNRSFTLIVIYCFFLNFSVFSPTRVFNNSRLTVLKYELMYFYALLIEDLLSLMASLMFIPVFASFEMFYKKGLILVTIFSTDF